MKNCIILIPVFNDWESVIKLLDNISVEIKEISKVNFKCIIINDASTLNKPEMTVPEHIDYLKLINMKVNKGHARCIAYGIRYVLENEKFDHLILMDGDGEDRPEEIKFLINKALEEEKVSVVAKRIKRSEGPIFQILYQAHKLLTLVFTGKNINFGNYSCLTKNDVEIISNKASLWSSFSGSLKKNIKNLNHIDSIRGIRYFGPSKMSFFKLAIHSFSIIAVFKRSVFLRSIAMIIIASYFSTKAIILVPSFQILLVIFNLLIYLISRREDQDALNNSHLNHKNTDTYTH